jgi:hypothetical protein
MLNAYLCSSPLTFLSAHAPFTLPFMLRGACWSDLESHCPHTLSLRRRRRSHRGDWPCGPRRGSLTLSSPAPPRLALQSHAGSITLSHTLSRLMKRPKQSSQPFKTRSTKTAFSTSRKQNITTFDNPELSSRPQPATQPEPKRAQKRRHHVSTTLPLNKSPPACA